MMPTKYTSINEATFGHQGYVPDVSMEWVNGFGTMGTHCWSAEKTEEAYKDAMDELISKVYGK